MEIVKKKIVSYTNSQEISLITPGIYEKVSSSLTSEKDVNDYIGLSYNTYYRLSSEYSNIGRKYLNFKSIQLDINNTTIPNEDDVQDSILSLTGYDESLSAIKNFNYILDSSLSANYEKYLDSIETILSFTTHFTINNIKDFYQDHASLTGYDIEYSDSIHVLKLQQKRFRFDFFDLDNLIFSPEITFESNNILKYNFKNNLKYKELYYKYQSLYNILVGFIYEDGTIILCTPILLTDIFSAPTTGNIVFTCLGNQSYNYNFSSSSVTGLTSPVLKDTQGFIWRYSGGNWTSITSTDYHISHMNVNKGSDMILYSFANIQNYTATSLKDSTNFIQHQRFGSANHFLLKAGNKNSSTTSIVDDNIFWSSRGSLYRDNNFSTSISSASLNYTESNITNLTIDENGVLFASITGFLTSGWSVSGGTILKSYDNGITWKLSGQGIDNPAIAETVPGLLLSLTGGVILCGTNFSTTSNGGIYISSNSGDTWSRNTADSSSSLAFGYTLDDFTKKFRNKFNNYGYISTDSLYSGASRKTYLTTDNGSSFSSLTSLTSMKSACVNNQGIVYCIEGIDNSIKKSGTANDNFTVISTTGLAGIFSRIVCSTNNNILYCLTDKGVYKSTNDGLNWTQVYATLLGKQLLINEENEIILIGTSSIGILKSIDGGTTWTQISVVGVSNNRVPSAVNKLGDFFFSNLNSLYFIRKYSNVVKRLDINSFMMIKHVSDIKHSGTAAFISHLDSGMFDKYSYGTSELLKQKNDGLTNKNCMGIAINGGNLFVATNGGGVLTSSTSSISYSQANGDLTDLNLISIGTDQSATGTVPVFIGTKRNGIFKTSNGGTNWINKGLTSHPISCIDYNHSLTSVVVGTRGNGVWLSQNGGDSWIQLTGLTSNYINQVAIMNDGSVIAAGYRYAYSSAIANLSISSFDVILDNEKNIINLTLKIPKENYNLSQKQFASDGSKLKDTPFISKIGLLNEKNKLMAIGKLSKPIPKTDDRDIYLNFDIEIT